MQKTELPKNENIYETDCPILFAMELIGQKWKLPILWYIADKEVIRYNELQRKVVGITATMLTKDLRELESDGLINRVQYNTIPPTVEYSLTDKGKTLLFPKMIPILIFLKSYQSHLMNTFFFQCLHSTIDKLSCNPLIPIICMNNRVMNKTAATIVPGVSPSVSL